MLRLGDSIIESMDPIGVGLDDCELNPQLLQLAVDDVVQKANERIDRPSAIAADVAVDLIAGALPLVAQATTIAKGIARAQKAHEERAAEWTAVLMALRRPRRPVNLTRP